MEFVSTYFFLLFVLFLPSCKWQDFADSGDYNVSVVVCFCVNAEKNKQKIQTLPYECEKIFMK